MTKVPVYNLNGKEVKQIELPEHFSQELRPDLITRAFLAIMSHKRQAYGADPLAGKRTSANYRGRRYAYGSWANRGLARLPRIRVGSGHMVGVVRFMPHAVKGRKAHPPKAEKMWWQKINRKERIKAILSAISATAIKDVVLKRGHRVENIKALPIVVVSELEKIKKTKDVEKLLEKLGLEEELKRTKEKRYRAGRGKMRGRRYKKRKGPLIVVEKDEGIVKAASNIPGVDIVVVDNLNVELLAPGAHGGRLTIWSENAIKALKDKKLFAIKV
jgi:large subunit ribosomal protein L4e